MKNWSPLLDHDGGCLQNMINKSTNVLFTKRPAGGVFMEHFVNVSAGRASLPVQSSDPGEAGDDQDCNGCHGDGCQHQVPAFSVALRDETVSVD